MISLVKDHPENKGGKKEDSLNLSFVSEKEADESDEVEVQQSIFRFNKKKNPKPKNVMDES